MAAILELLKAIAEVLPFILQILKIFKGQPSEVRKEALSVGKAAISNHLDGNAPRVPDLVG